MKSNVVVASIFGSLAVYTAMVACSTADDLNLSGGNLSGGSGGHAGSVGNGGQINSGGKDAGGIIDVLVDAMPQAAADPISGSRLKAKYQQNEDGSKAYLPFMWYDSQRKEDCSFLYAADGMQRCLPSGPRALGGLYFSDPACTVPLASYIGGCTLSYIYTTELPADLCTSPALTHYFAVGPKKTPATVYIKSGASCLSSAPSATTEYYDVGPEIPPSSFVAGTVMVDP